MARTRRDRTLPPREIRPRSAHGETARPAITAHFRSICRRYDVVIDVDSRDCPCCGGALHAIGELCTEQLDIVPTQLRVRVTRRPRYACRAREGAVVVAPAPERPIDGGMATEALVAHVVVNKFADSLPLYRRAQMLARQDRSTLANWVGRACWWLTPLYDLVVSTVLSSGKLFADDTTLPVLDPGRGRTKTGRLRTGLRQTRTCWLRRHDRQPRPGRAFVRQAAGRTAAAGPHAATLQSAAAVPPISSACSVMSISYAGDEGGVVCELDLLNDSGNAIDVSITHLHFDPRLPAGRDIAAYQKHRVKHIRRRAG